MSFTRKRIELQLTQVIDNILIADGVYYLKLHKPFDFKPGQVVALSLNENDEPRLYSIASGKNEVSLNILFDVMPTGQLTPTLANLKPNDEVYISAPFGKFLCEHTPAVWIATGTGVAPFVSLIKSGTNKNITLLHGARTIDGFYFQNEFKEKLGDDYLRFCTTETGNDVIEGRLTNYLKELDNPAPELKYYLCGSSQMIIDVREILLSKGVAYDKIIAEIYF
ncbi:FAD-binding oxidoreductase [Carboxylicivirga sp. N1Y90]|uniref:FAD-binding oxidoreductase n=1 Tax=Carboxylicivirga fragile TaxID=3417571 RepID=UPI003D34F02D|nr:oxidoreductase [Marinilabiliaceae bacterium N1Y90]